MKKWKIEITKQSEYHTYIYANTFQEAEEKAKLMIQTAIIDNDDFEDTGYYDIISKYRGEEK